MRVGRHLVQFLDEDRTLGLQTVDDELVVDDLMPDIDRRAMLLEREFDDADGAIHPGTEAARGGDQQVEGRLDGVGHGDGSTPLLARVQPGSYAGGQTGILLRHPE